MHLTDSVDQNASNLAKAKAMAMALAYGECGDGH